MNIIEIIQYAQDVIMPSNPDMEYEEAIIQAYKVLHETQFNPLSFLDKVCQNWKKIVSEIQSKWNLTFPTPKSF